MKSPIQQWIRPRWPAWSDQNCISLLQRNQMPQCQRPQLNRVTHHASCQPCAFANYHVQHFMPRVIPSQPFICPSTMCHVACLTTNWKWLCDATLLYAQSFGAFPVNAVKYGPIRAKLSSFIDQSQRGTHITKVSISLLPKFFHLLLPSP